MLYVKADQKYIDSLLASGVAEHLYCEMGSGHLSYFPSIDRSLAERGIRAELRRSKSGGRQYRIPLDQAVLCDICDITRQFALPGGPEQGCIFLTVWTTPEIRRGRGWFGEWQKVWPWDVPETEPSGARPTL